MRFYKTNSLFFMKNKFLQAVNCVKKELSENSYDLSI